MELNFYSPPVQPWHHPEFENAGLKVDVLRLDLMHPIIGGNKWMKLRGFLKKTQAENKSGILTKGGPWSNHVHACAWACQQMNLRFDVWIKGHDKLTSAMLDDVKQWGANIRFVNRFLFYDDSAAEDSAAENNLLYVPMGGAEETGVRETANFLHELHLTLYKYAACAVGTATTFGGLSFTSNNFEKVIGIEVGTNDAAVTEKISEWQQQLPKKQMQLIAGYIFGGFARHTPELLNFANELKNTYQIPTDIVYTSKLFYAIQDLSKKDFFQANSSLLIIHSGGLQGNRSLPKGLLHF